MSRDERFSTDKEISRIFSDFRDTSIESGPIVRKINNILFTDSSAAHVEVCGNTGMGKTQGVTLPLVKQIADKGESGVVTDSKGEIYKKVGGYFKHYTQKYCIDFSDPRNSPTGWDPLNIIKKLNNSKTPSDNDTANTLMSDLWSCVYPDDLNNEGFWTESSRNYAKGLAYGAIEVGDEGEANLSSVNAMMEQSETRFGMSPLIKQFYESLPLDSMARRNLATYTTAPNETRGSIHSVAATGLEIFSRSRGLMEMLNNDTLDILNIDVTKPFIIFIILPQETEAYDRLAGLLVSQIIGHLLRAARKLKDDRLPIRTSIILEELGSVGKSLPDLHKWIAQGRSKNIRLYLILQSDSQLEDVFGKNKAETIRSCVGITIGFSSNNWDMMEEWSRKCGEEWVMKDGNMVKDRLVQTSKLAAMPKGMALIMVNNRFKFFSQLPFFYEMYSPCALDLPAFNQGSQSQIKIFDLESYVKNNKKNQMETMLSGNGPERRSPDMPFGFPFLDAPQSNRAIDVDDMVKKIEAKIAEMKAAEEAEKKKTEEEKKTEEDKEHNASRYTVTVFVSDNEKSTVAEIIARHKGISLDEANKQITDFPVEVTFAEKNDANGFMQELEKCGIIAMICD